MERITLVINRIDTPGGAERVMTVLASCFVKKGIDVTIITRQSEESFYPLDERVKVVATAVSGGFAPLRNLKRNLKLRAEIRKSNPDVVLSFMTPMNIQTLFYTIGLNVPVVISERNNPETDISKRDKIFAKLLYPFAAGSVFQTEQAKQWFSEKIQRKSTVIPNPISENLPQRKTAIPGKIVSVGRLTKQKNHKMLIDAFAKYSEQNKDVTLTIYGRGPMKEELEKYILAKGMQEKITLGGHRQDVMEVISDAELFVLSSDYEGMPNALIEAMGIGLPCISTDCPCGGPRELIENKVNGVLVPVGDVDAMANAINELLETEELAQRIGKNAANIRKTLDCNKISEQWIDYLSNI